MPSQLKTTLLHTSHQITFQTPVSCGGVPRHPAPSSGVDPHSWHPWSWAGSFPSNTGKWNKSELTNSLQQGSGISICSISHRTCTLQLRWLQWLPCNLTPGHCLPLCKHTPSEIIESLLLLHCAALHCIVSLFSAFCTVSRKPGKRTNISNLTRYTVLCCR